MMPRSAQSSLSHCTTTRPGIEAGSSGTTASSRPAAMTMPPECWPRWRGRFWICCHQIDEQLHARRLGIDAAGLQLQRQVVGGVAELEAPQQLRQAVDLFEREAERLADLAHGAARAVGDDVGGHRRAARAVALVDVLDDALALVAARQVDVDVRPLAALLRQKALEEQLHADGVDGGDAEGVAHRRVGRRAAPLREDVLLAAEAHDVPDDEEVAGEVRACR